MNDNLKHIAVVTSAHLTEGERKLSEKINKEASKIINQLCNLGKEKSK